MIKFFSGLLRILALAILIPGAIFFTLVGLAALDTGLFCIGEILRILFSDLFPPARRGGLWIDDGKHGPAPKGIIFSARYGFGSFGSAPKVIDQAKARAEAVLDKPGGAGRPEGDK